MYKHASLDEDLYGTRATDNQVKSLNKRSADAEGNTADFIVDVFQQVTLGVRFRRRGENLHVATALVLSRSFETREEVSRGSIFVTVNRGYARASFMAEVQ